MCGRYQLSPEESAEIAKIVMQVQDRIRTGEIFPTYAVPVLAEFANELAPRPMVWGYPKFGGKSGHIINARSETTLDRPMFRKSLLERRCVIPTTGFFEWGPGAAGKKIKYRFNLPGDRALYLAGLWNDFVGEERCVILTTAANESMGGIHERMPIVLETDALVLWISNTDSALDILQTVPPELVYEIA